MDEEIKNEAMPVEETPTQPTRNLRDDPPKDINNNSMYSTLQAATNQVIGRATYAAIDMQGIIDAGKTWSFDQREQWVKVLTGMYIKDMYTDRKYKDRRNDVFYEDSAKFGAITRIMSMEMPDIIQNRSWMNVTSGVTTIGSNTIYLPIVDQQLYGATDSWGVSIAYTGTQLNAAFDSEEGLMEFDNYVKLMAQNAIELHRATMNGMNRNNYMAEKIYTGNSAGKINVVDLVGEYVRDNGITTALSAQQFMATPAAMRYAVKTLKKYKSMLMDMSTLFTTKADSRGKFIPEDRFVCQILADFEGRMEVETYSTTYHDEFIKMPNYRSVNSWQALTYGDSAATFDLLSSISAVTADGNTMYRSGIVGLMVDKWAIMHTMVQNRVGYQRDDIKDISMYDYQFTDRYMNNLTLNGIVFVLNDFTPTSKKSK